MEILNIIKLIFKLKLEQLAAAELTEPFHSGRGDLGSSSGSPSVPAALAAARCSWQGPVGCGGPCGVWVAP